MPNPNGRRGAQWETDLAAYYAANGFPLAERRARTGIHDKGDLTGISPLVVHEAKNEKVINLPGYLREAEVERANADAALGVVLVKRRNASVAQGYWVVTIETGVAIERALILGEPWCIECICGTVAPRYCETASSATTTSARTPWHTLLAR